MSREKHRTATETNVDSFSTDDMVERYADRRGLYEKEEVAVSRYFREDGARVLDVGCGTGRTTAPLTERGFDVVGIDISERMIERARTLLPDVEFRVGDVTDLDFDDDEFDYALFAHNGLDYVHPARERRRALRELRRVVRPGGVVVFSTHNAWYRFPALFADHSFLRTFYLDNGNLRRLFRRYKVDLKEGDPLWTYVSDPRKQRRQLEQAGLEPLELVTPRDGVGRYFEAMLYYVAESR
jgi:SAM-dependent methyltransferase